MPPGKKKASHPASAEDTPRMLPDDALSDACRRILANQESALSIRDRDFRPLFANEAYLRLFDTTLDEWMRGHWSSHFGKGSAPYVEDVVIPTIMSGRRWQGELEIVTPGGASKQVMAELNGIRDESGEIVNFYAAYSEITRLKYLERELQNQVDFLHSIIDALPDIMIVKNESHDWVVVNEAFCKVSGRSREELIGKSDYDYFPPEEAEVFWRQDDEAMASGQEVANEETITGKSGDTRILSTKKTSFRHSDGRKYLVGTARDVTDERRLERAMAESYHQLETALAALKSGLGSIQNDLATEASKADAIRGLITRSNESFRHYLKESGLQPSPRESGTGPARMSPREYQVFLLLAKGTRIKDAAEHLGVSPNTVSTYRARIMNKLGLSSITELIQYAMRNGLL